MESQYFTVLLDTVLNLLWKGNYQTVECGVYGQTENKTRGETAQTTSYHQDKGGPALSYMLMPAIMKNNASRGHQTELTGSHRTTQGI